MHTKALTLLTFLSISIQINGLKIKTSSKGDRGGLTISYVPTWLPYNPSNYHRDFLYTTTVASAANNLKWALWGTEAQPPEGNGEIILTWFSGLKNSKDNPTTTIKDAWLYGILGPLKLDYTGKKIGIKIKLAWGGWFEHVEIFEDLRVDKYLANIVKKWKEKDKIAMPVTDGTPEAFLYGSKKLIGYKTFKENGISDFAELQIDFNKLKLSITQDWVPEKPSIDVILDGTRTLRFVIDELIKDSFGKSSPAPPTGDGSFELSCNNKKLDKNKSLIDNGVRTFNKCIMDYTGAKIQVTFNPSWGTYTIYQGTKMSSMKEYLLNKSRKKGFTVWSEDIDFLTDNAILNDEKTFKENGIKNGTTLVLSHRIFI